MPNQYHRSKTYLYLLRRKTPRTAARIAKATHQNLHNVRIHLRQLLIRGRIIANGTPLQYSIPEKVKPSEL